MTTKCNARDPELDPGTELVKKTAEIQTKVVV